MYTNGFSVQCLGNALFIQIFPRCESPNWLGILAAMVWDRSMESAFFVPFRRTTGHLKKHDKLCWINCYWDRSADFTSRWKVPSFLVWNNEKTDFEDTVAILMGLIETYSQIQGHISILIVWTLFWTSKLDTNRRQQRAFNKPLATIQRGIQNSSKMLVKNRFLHKCSENPFTTNSVLLLLDIN